MKKPATVEEYLMLFPPATRKILEKVRDTIRKAAPAAKEYMGYGMPAYNHNGPLVYFGGYKQHVGFYATPTGHSQFSKELSRYKQGKGSVQFPLEEPMPLALISRIVAYRIKENASKEEERKKKSPAKKAASEKTAVKRKKQGPGGRRGL